MAEWILTIVAAYLLVGGLFAIAFVSAGVSRVDHAAKGAPLGFRLLILPGAAAMWPLMLLRWIRSDG